MRVQEHAEFERYQRDAALVSSCRQAIAEWIKDGESIIAPDGVVWTPSRARELVGEIGGLFHQYNLVLWQSFSYCQQCRGGCCVAGASQVTAFDALALALLALPFPEVGPRAAAGDCIYLGSTGCRWPSQWRPVKCWAFYCLGSGDWELDAADVRYERITAALRAVLREYLPGFLRLSEHGNRDPLHTFLADPIGFAEELGSALSEIFVAPFSAVYGPLDAQYPKSASNSAQREERRLARERALAFIARAVEQLWQEPTSGQDQFLDDLERLEWIVLQSPPDAREALRGLLQRYSEDADGRGDVSYDEPSLQKQMALTLSRLLQDFGEQKV